MNPGPVFGRVYTALREQLMGARWPPGAHLEPTAIGDDLGASITPVRDALHRLVGEGLIEAPRQDGFWVPAKTETQLRELYAWNGDLLGWALRRRRQALPTALAAAGDPPDAGVLFCEIARAAQNPELERAIASSSDRLAEYRMFEGEVLDGVGEEMARIAQNLSEDRVDRLRSELGAYHRRRQRAAPLLLSARRRGPDPLRG